jgi:hypothetical protein
VDISLPRRMCLPVISCARSQFPTYCIYPFECVKLRRLRICPMGVYCGLRVTPFSYSLFAASNVWSCIRVVELVNGSCLVI